MAYQFSFQQYDRPTIGLYIHIPFCVRKCDYCDFYSLANTSLEERSRFQRALLEWLAQISTDVEGKVVDTIYIGGGTPSCYGTKELAEILKKVREWYPLTQDCEITVECNPDSATEVWLSAMKEAGVNRLSMGVQSANDDELRRVGRLHDFAAARKSFEAARRIGYENLSLDLIYGLPDQTMEDWQRSVETVIALEPDHLSCYGLKVEEGTPLYECQADLMLADDDEQADMYLWMVNRLERAGYGQYEISNFAKPGKHSRHNMRYWLGQEYLCAGPSAHCYTKGYRSSISRSMEDFCTGVFGACHFWDEHRRVDENEQIREYVLLQMRTTWGISAEEYEYRFGLRFAPLEAKLLEFERYGWAAQAGERWHLTSQGFLVSNALIVQLLDIVEKQLFE